MWVAGDRVYVAAGYGSGCRSFEIGPENSVTLLWENNEMVNHHGGVIKFDIDPFKKHCLLNGLDDIVTIRSCALGAAPSRGALRDPGRDNLGAVTVAPAPDGERRRLRPGP